MRTIRNYGAIPFFSWSSQAHPGGGDEPDFQLADVIAGPYDAYIREFAEAARDWGHPFFLRFDWEMNGNWFPWCGGVNGNSPGEYVAAWRHVHDIFTAVGATNATWVWCPYAEAAAIADALKPLLPGRRIRRLDLPRRLQLGQEPANPQPWRSFDADLRPDPTARLVHKVAPSKPMVLAEMASSGDGQAKAAWIRGMFKQIATHFRRIRGLIWFDQVDRGVDWPLETSAAASRRLLPGRSRTRLPGQPLRLDLAPARSGRRVIRIGLAAYCPGPASAPASAIPQQTSAWGLGSIRDKQ